MGGTRFTLRIVSALVVVVASGCGKDVGAMARGDARGCPGMPGISYDPATDLTGEGNDGERVERIKHAAQKDLFRYCRGVAGIGIGRADLEDGRVTGSIEKSWLISIDVRLKSGLPRAPIFLDGVPLRFHYCGRPPIADVRWSSGTVQADGRTIRLIHGDSSSRRPAEVLVRTTPTQVHLTMRMHDPGCAVHKDLKPWCAQITLREPIGGRRLVDDGPGTLPDAQRLRQERQIARRLTSCVRVPAMTR